MEVGAYEAKTHLPKLLEKVANGERIVITKHGTPVAVLTPAATKTKKSVEDAIDEIRTMRKGRTLGKLKLKDLIEQGRR